jgi:hypothetical protein
LDRGQADTEGAGYRALGLAGAYSGDYRLASMDLGAFLLTFCLLAGLLKETI